MKMDEEVTNVSQEDNIESHLPKWIRILKELETKEDNTS